MPDQTAQVDYPWWTWPVGYVTYPYPAGNLHSYGWECPKCGRIYAPAMVECSKCNTKVSMKLKSDTNTVSDSTYIEKTPAKAESETV